MNSKIHLAACLFLASTKLDAAPVTGFEMQCDAQMVQGVKLAINYKILYEKGATAWIESQQVNVQAKGNPATDSAWTADQIEHAMLGGNAVDVTYAVAATPTASAQNQVNWLEIPVDPILQDLQGSPDAEDFVEVKAPGSLLTLRFTTADGREFVLAGVLRGPSEEAHSSQSGTEYGQTLNVRFYQRTTNIGGFGVSQLADGDPFRIRAPVHGSFDMNCQIADRYPLLRAQGYPAL